MSRPPAASLDQFVDAAVCARAGTVTERSFSGSDLPRLAGADVAAGSRITLRLRFAQQPGGTAIDGELSGSVVMTCQRCMKPVRVPLEDRFSLIVVADESVAVDESTGYEAIVADPSRLDLRWLAEEQTLLALPLVPMHESADCRAQQVAIAQAPEADAGTRHRPFENLRDRLRER